MFTHAYSIMPDLLGAAPVYSISVAA